MPPALVLEHISKQFGPAQALEDVSFSLEPGEILGLVGPNGAGKTTAMQIATGFLLPSSGDGTLMGRAFGDASARRQLGFVPDAPVFFGGTARDALRFAAQMSDVTPTQDVMEGILRRVGLTEWKRDVRRFSRGMQQRLALALALVHHPKLLILDEPASALDPQGVLDVRNLLRELRAEGVAILLSSHQLGEVASVSDRIAFLHEGRLVRYGRLDALLGVVSEVDIVLRNLKAARGFAARWGAAAEPPDRWRVSTSQVREFLEAVWRSGGTLVSVTPVQGDLTSLFLEWTSGGVGRP